MIEMIPNGDLGSKAQPCWWPRMGQHTSPPWSCPAGCVSKGGSTDRRPIEVGQDVGGTREMPEEDRYRLFKNRDSDSDSR